MQVFPVGCIDNGHAVYIHVAAPTSDEAENFVRQNRPYLEVISVLPSNQVVEGDKVRTVRVAKEP